MPTAGVPCGFGRGVVGGPVATVPCGLPCGFGCFGASPVLAFLGVRSPDGVELRELRDAILMRSSAEEASKDSEVLGIAGAKMAAAALMGSHEEHVMT